MLEVGGSGAFDAFAVTTLLDDDDGDRDDGTAVVAAAQVRITILIIENNANQNGH